MSAHRILVVEDNPLNLKLVRDILVFQGHAVIEAHTGEEGIDLVTRCAPDLVLMDLQLPGLDGFQTLARIRAQPRGRALPILAVTAFAMKDDRERALAAGFDGYLSKPIDVHSLAEQLETVLAGNDG